MDEIACQLKSMFFNYNLVEIQVEVAKCISFEQFLIKKDGSLTVVLAKIIVN